MKPKVRLYERVILQCSCLTQLQSSITVSYEWILMMAKSYEEGNKCTQNSCPKTFSKIKILFFRKFNNELNFEYISVTV